MADVTITAANVLRAEGPVEHNVDTSSAIDVGQIVTVKDANEQVGLAANTSQALSQVYGMALNRAVVAGQPITVALSGAVVALGSVLTEGEFYVVSAAGAISPIGDKLAGDWMAVVGYARSATELVLAISIYDEQL